MKAETSSKATPSPPSGRRIVLSSQQKTDELRKKVMKGNLFRWHEKEAEERRQSVQDALSGVPIRLALPFLVVYITKLMRAYYDTASMSPYDCLLTAALWGLLLLHLDQRPDFTQLLLAAVCVIMTIAFCFTF